MTTAIRFVSRRSLWDRGEKQTSPRLGADDLAADALVDMRTSSNRLSVYLIDSTDSPNFDRLIAAYAASRDHLTKVDLAAFDPALFEELEIRMDNVPGDTPDVDANSWHRDLVELSASKLALLGTQIRLRATLVRRRDSQVTALVKQSLEAKFIDRSKLRPEIAARII